MKKMNSSDVYVFNKVARTLSFTVAAREAGTSRSTISKRISRLEQSLGVMLLNRSTRSVSLTEAGRILYENTSEVDAILERAVDCIHAAELEPTGTVRLSMPSGIGPLLLPSLITQFQESWPDVDIDIHVEDHTTDLIAGGYDLAICVAQKLKDSNLVSRRLGSTPRVLAASRAYLEQFGIPHCVEDLANHRCLGFRHNTSTGASWQFRTSDGVIENPGTFPILTNNVQSLIDAACRGNGIIYVPRAFISSALAQRRLEHLLPDSYSPDSYGIFAVYPHRNAAAKVRVLVDFIDQEMKSQGMFD